ncbi:MAG: hypothetical protein AOA66_0862 [Candidatus Bathyarchaeota archaeon BA2]|nr:MAG: hypothetical protein AOA66_0862 [Candidatus Bathyarchaeota archaeon BA2]
MIQKALNKMRTPKIFRFVFNKKAVSTVISATILTGVAIASGFAVLAWAQMR